MATSLTGRLVQLGFLILALFAIRLGAGKWLLAFPRGLDILHMLFGAGLAYFFFETSRSKWGLEKRGRSCGVAVCGVLLVSGLVEWSQPLLHQERDLWDMVATMAGAITLCVYRGALTDTPLSAMRLGVAILACIASVLVGLWRPLVEIADAGLRRHQFPVLASFESPLELCRWTPRGCQIRRIQRQDRHGHVLQVKASESIAYPGISSHKLPSDWTGYERLHFSAASDRPLVLTLRIDDQAEPPYANRCQISCPLDGDWREITVNLAQELKTPEGRSLALSRISAVTFFVERALTSSVVFLLDDVRLRP